MPDKNDHPILQGHVLQGNKFIPKLLTLGTPFHNVSYINVMIPELIWLALINERLGIKRGADFIGIVSTTLGEMRSRNDSWFPAATCFGLLNDEAKNSVIKALDTNEISNAISNALAPFVSLYPQFPGRFLVNTKQTEDYSKFLSEYKQLLFQLYDTESSATVFMCANATYASFCLDQLRVDSSTALSRFPEIENYPATEISKTIASSCRSLTLEMIGTHIVNKQLTNWSFYFWNHGLEIESIDWSEMEG